MKKLITAILLTSALVAAPSAYAESVTCRVDGQYGGSVCGVETSTTVVEHKTVSAGANDNQIATVILTFAGVAIVASALYKLTYRNYLLG